MRTTTRNTKYPRRQRPEYPVLAPGNICLMTRPECGRNIEHPAAAIKEKRARRIITGGFFFERPIHPGTNRSKYTPHAGKKQQARLTTLNTP